MPLVYLEDWALTPAEDVPGEPGSAFRFRRLTGAELDEAEAVASAKAIKTAADFAEIVVKLQNIDTGPKNADAERDPLRDYDAAVLVRYGLAAWGYTNPHDGTVEPCTAEAKSRLDATARDWAARKIAALMVRPQGE